MDESYEERWARLRAATEGLEPRPESAQAVMAAIVAKADASHKSRVSIPPGSSWMPWRALNPVPVRYVVAFAACACFALGLSAQAEEASVQSMVLGFDLDSDLGAQ